MTSSCESRESTERRGAPLAGPVTLDRAEPLSLDELNPANIVRDEGMGGPRRPGRADSERTRVIREAAHRAAAAAVERGWEAGYATGLAAGRDQGLRSTRADVERAIAALAAAADVMRSGAATDLAQAEDALVAGAFELAATILDRELEVAANPGADALRRALALASSGDVEAHLHPEDLAVLAPDAQASGPVSFVADPNVERGGCVLVNGATTIDAQLGPALARARAFLLGEPAASGIERGMA